MNISVRGNWRMWRGIQCRQFTYIEGGMKNRKSFRLRYLALLMLVGLILCGFMYNNRHQIECLLLPKEDQLTNPVISYVSATNCHCHFYRVDIYWTGAVVFTMITFTGEKTKTKNISPTAVKRLLTELRNARFLCSGDQLNTRLPFSPQLSVSDDGVLTLSARETFKSMVLQGISVEHGNRIFLALSEILREVELKKLIRE
jgi:hypothetical protein